MKPKRKPCDLCGGSRHRFDEDKKAFVACNCLSSSRNVERYRLAGVPVVFEKETWKTLLDTYRVGNTKLLLSTAKTLSGEDTPDQWLLIHGTPARARSLISALLLRAACDGRFSCRALDLPTLIDGEFQPGRGQEIYELDMLVIDVGGEPANKWNRHVLGKALKIRWAKGLYTVIVADGDPARLGTLYKSAEIEEALSSRFKRIRVDKGER